MFDWVIRQAIQSMVNHSWKMKVDASTIQQQKGIRLVPRVESKTGCYSFPFPVLNNFDNYLLGHVQYPDADRLEFFHHLQGELLFSGACDSYGYDQVREHRRLDGFQTIQTRFKLYRP